MLLAWLGGRHDGKLVNTRVFFARLRLEVAATEVARTYSAAGKILRTAFTINFVDTNGFRSAIASLKAHDISDLAHVCFAQV